MEKKEIKTALINITAAKEKLSKKDFRLFFFVADSKGTPIGSLSYTYELAYKLKELGYDVRMLYAEKEFVGVANWLGSKYASLPHFNTTNDNVDIAPSDFLFIPELFSNVMTSVKKLPCKKIAILQSFNFMTELIPFGASWDSLGIRDCITTSESMKERLLEVFPDTKVLVIKPSIDKVFKKKEGKHLIVNIITKDEKDINTIVKPFKWMFPIYNFVTFRYIHGRSREEEAKYLSEGEISVWIDDKTDFGYTPLEAMACGNIVIGKIPENEPEWLVDEKGDLKNNGIWCYKTREIVKMLGSVIQTLLYDKIPQEFYDEIKKTVSEYTDEKQVEQIKATLSDIVETREKELSLMISALKNNLDKEDK